MTDPARQKAEEWLADAFYDAGAARGDDYEGQAAVDCARIAADFAERGWSVMAKDMHCLGCECDADTTPWPLPWAEAMKEGGE